MSATIHLTIKSIARQLLHTEPFGCLSPSLRRGALQFLVLVRSVLSRYASVMCSFDCQPQPGIKVLVRFVLSVPPVVYSFDSRFETGLMRTIACRQVPCAVADAPGLPQLAGSTRAHLLSGPPGDLVLFPPASVLPSVGVRLVAFPPASGSARDRAPPHRPLWRAAGFCRAASE